MKNALAARGQHTLQGGGCEWHASLQVLRHASCRAWPCRQAAPTCDQLGRRMPLAVFTMPQVPAAGGGAGGQMGGFGAKARMQASRQPS